MGIYSILYQYFGEVTIVSCLSGGAFTIQASHCRRTELHVASLMNLHYGGDWPELDGGLLKWDGQKTH